MISVARLLSCPPSPPTPRGHPQERWGNGRIELQIYQGIGLEDRLAAAATLLRGTGFAITPTGRETPR
jgi:hypothetical protein